MPVTQDELTSMASEEEFRIGFPRETLDAIAKLTPEQKSLISGVIRETVIVMIERFTYQQEKEN